MSLPDPLRLRKRPSAADKVDALRLLVAGLRAGAPMRTAIIEWPCGVPAPALPFLQGAARRARLGAPLADVLEPCAQLFGDDHHALRSAVELHLSCGADAASMLDGLASEMAEREVEGGNARAHAAGAKLSARLVGGLPLVFIPLMPSGEADLLDPFGLTLLVSGLLLALGGMRWLGRLLPEPPSATDTTMMVATTLARCFEAGAELGPALELVATGAARRERSARTGEGQAQDREGALVRAARRGRLGLSVSSALAVSEHDGLVSIGRCIARAERSGAPPARELMRLADARRAELRREFEREMRRAPVKMVVPLTLCVLPSFALLGLAPFLRGVTIGA